MRRHTPAPTPLQAAALAVLQRSGALQLDELADVLEADGLDLGSRRLEDLDRALLQRDDVDELPDGRILHIPTAVDAAVATSRLTDEERSSGVVEMEPDLQVLALSFPETYELAAGGTAQVRVAHEDAEDGDPGRWQLVGPPGWLGGVGAGDLTAFRLADGRLHVERAAVLGDVDEAADILYDSFGEQSADGDPIETRQLLLAVLIDHPHVLRQALPPLSEILEDADLEMNGDWVGEVGTDWGAPGYGGAAYGLDDVGEEALSLLLASFSLAAAEEEGFERLAAEPQLVEQLGAVLSFEGVAQAFAAEALGADATNEEVEPVRRWAEAVAAGGPTEPGAHWVLATCAEQLGATEAAEQHLRAALAADADYGPALLDAAWFAEDRGDAVRALSLLRRADIGDDDPQVERLEAYARPGPAAAGRNDPCPCGSGRKYKVCCAQRNGHSLSDRVPWLLAKASEFVQRPPRRALITAIAIARTGGDEEDPAWVDAAMHDPIVTDVALFEGGALAQLCDERGPLLPADELELARTWTDRPLRLYEVAAVHTGTGVTLRDLLTDEHTDASDRAASTQLGVGELLLGRLLPIGTGWRLSPAVMQVPSELRDRLLSFLETKPGAEEIAAWLAASEGRPTLQTADGDPVVRCDLRLRVPDPTAAARALDGALERDLGHWVSHAEHDGERLLLGAVHLDGAELHVTAASERRFEALVREVRAAIGEAETIDEQRQPAG